MIHLGLGGSIFTKDTKRAYTIDQIDMNDFHQPAYSDTTRLPLGGNPAAQATDGII
jgi:hypothetical protein